MAALSLATDLGLGQPLQHELGVCLAALEVADRLRCSTEECADVYYVALVAHVGCTGAAGLFADWASGDDIHFQRGAQVLGAVSEPSEDLRYFLRRFADDRPLPERVWLRGRMLVGGKARFEVMAANLCEGATLLAAATGSALAGRAGARAADRALGRQRAAGTGGRRADLTSAAHRAQVRVAEIDPEIRGIGCIRRSDSHSVCEDLWRRVLFRVLMGPSGPPMEPAPITNASIPGRLPRDVCRGPRLWRISGREPPEGAGPASVVRRIRCRARAGIATVAERSLGGSDRHDLRRAEGPVGGTLATWRRSRRL